MVWISPKLLEGYKFTFILWFCTFLIVVPLCAQRWVFSPYFSASTDYKSQAPEIVENLNTRRFFEAENYLWALNPTENEQLHSNGLRTTTKSRMAAVVTTMKRSVKCGRSSAERNCEPHYLQRTMAALDREAKAYFTKGGEFVPILICNVDGNGKEFKDFGMVRHFFPFTRRQMIQPNSADPSPVKLNSNQLKRSQQSSDYAFCLDALYNITNGGPTYALVFEDDAVAFPNLFENVFHILDSRVERKQIRGEWVTLPDWSYLKLYYPEKWAGFSWDFPMVRELCFIALVGALVGIFCNSWECRRRGRNQSSLAYGVLGAVYAVLLALAISRQTLLEILRISPFFLQVRHDKGCCIPAVIYQMKALPGIVNYLDSHSTAARRSEGVDLALDDWTRENVLVPYLVEPSLVRHIGMYSSLTTRKDAIQMLFYDLMYGEA